MKTLFASCLRLCLLTGTWLGLVGIEAPAATVLFVNQNAPASSMRNGTSWANAYTDLNAAISNANPTATNPVELWIANGTYKPTTTTNRQAAFRLKSNLSLRGGFVGNENSPGQRLFYDLRLSVLFPKQFTILSGDIGQPQLPNPTLDPVEPGEPGLRDNCFNVVTALGVTNVLLENLTITGGCANGPKPDGTSYLSTEIQAMATPFLTDTNPGPAEIQKLYAGESLEPLDSAVAGGGIFVRGNYQRDVQDLHLTLIYCSVSQNFALGYGGGIAAHKANVALVGTLVAGNRTANEGGGVFSQNSRSYVSGCEFDQNEAVLSGGAVLQQSFASTNSVLPWSNDADVFNAVKTSRLDFHSYVDSTLAGAKFSARAAVDSSAFENVLLPRPQFDFGALGIVAVPGTGDEGNSVARDYGILAVKFALKLKTIAGFNDPSVWGMRFSGAKGYNHIQTIVAVVDLGFMIADLAGTSPNNPHVKNWNRFSRPFNKYCTPGGLATTLVMDVLMPNVFQPGLDEALDDTDKKAAALRNWQAHAFSQAPPSYFLNSKFTRNLSGSIGAGLAVVHDNIHVEGCKFTANRSYGDGAAICQGGWNTSVIISSGFDSNESFNGESGIANVGHCQAYLVNCTLANNISHTNGHAIGNYSGSDVQVWNCIIQENQNSVLNGTGDDNPDLYTATRAGLEADALQAGDTNGWRRIRNLGVEYVDWVAWCEIHHSSIEHLFHLPIGREKFFKFLKLPDQTAASINERVTLFNQANRLGLLTFFQFYNVGEGNRPGFHNGVWAENGNLAGAFDLEDLAPVPRTIPRPGQPPLITAPYLDRGSTNRLNNGYIDSVTGTDLRGNPRLQGTRFDLGCIESDSTLSSYVLHVRPTAPGSDGSGLSWANAMTNLQEALSVTNATVFVAAGTFKPTAGNDRTISFQIADGVRAYGGFRPDLGLTNLVDRNLALDSTVLSGDIGVAGDDSDNSHNLLKLAGISGAVLDGFTFTKARGETGTPGGALVCIGSSPEVVNCTFVDNQTTESGGAIYSSGGGTGPTLENCALVQNVAAKTGGALYYDSALTADRCRFEDNRAGSGGAIEVTGGDAIIRNSLFARNRAVAATALLGGGAIESSNANLQLFSCTVVDNTAAFAAGQTNGGGGIWFSSTNQALTLAIDNCILWGNRAISSSAILERQQYQYRFSGSQGIVRVNQNLIEGNQTPGSYASDPAFVDPAVGNYHLLSDSPGIDWSGIQSSVTNTLDLDGRTRAVNGRMDAGAYEFQGIPFAASPDVQITRQCNSGAPSVTLTWAGATNGSTFQWELNRLDGRGFVVVTNNVLYSGSTTPVLIIQAPTLEQNGYQYRLGINQGGVISYSGVANVFLQPNRYYVNAAATGRGTGRDWTNAFTTLRAAQDALLEGRDPENNCAEVWVAQGTYYPATDGDTNQAFELCANVGFYGGFAGGETNRNQRNWRTHPTILSGNLGNDRNSLNIVRAYGSPHRPIDGTAILDGFVVREAQGHAVDIFNGAPTIRNCDFVTNIGHSAVHSAEASPRLEQCRFLDNVSAFSAFYSSPGSTNLLVNCLFARNHSTHLGGALSAYSSATLLQNCTLTDNQSVNDGGGIYLQGNAWLSLVNSILWNNRSASISSNPFIAEIFNEQNVATITINNSIVRGLPHPALNGNQAFDPLFVAPHLSDYRLTAFSPAINAGNASGTIPNDDLNGEPRVTGGLVDAGAFEFQSAAAGPALFIQRPDAVTTCVGAGAISLTVVGVPSMSFQWQANSGTGFVTLSNDATYAITTTSNSSTLTIANPTVGLNNHLYRFIIPAINYTNAAVSLTMLPPSVLHVQATATGANNGTSWADAFTQLEDALDLATGCNEIWVAQGTYQARTDQFSFKPAVAVYGGFAGSETSRNQRQWTNYPTVLVAKTNSSIFKARGDQFVIDGRSVLDGFTLHSSQVAPAISLLRAMPSILNCTFENLPGLAIDNQFSSALISNCVFVAAAQGAVQNRQCAPTFLDCVFARNTNGSVGGAIYNYAASPSIERCRFETNSASSGSAMQNDNGSSPVISRSIFVGNQSTSGGAIDNNGGALRLVNCMLAGNRSDHFGAAIQNNGADVLLLHCTVANNRAARGGGGAYVFAGRLTSLNSVFWGNTVSGSVSTPERESQQIQFKPGAILQFSNSCIEGLSSWVGNSNFPDDPLFVAAALGDFNLGTNSPALNAGDNAFVADVATDLAGNARLFGAAVDPGAYERQAAAGPVVRLLTGPAAQSVCVSETATFTAAVATNQPGAIQWQVNAGSGFTNVIDDSTHQLNVSNGVHTLRVVNPTPAMTSREYRLYLDSANYGSAAATLSVTQPGIIYVNANAAGPGDGASWVTAFTNLQAAFAQGNHCSEIWVAQGSYPATPSIVGAYYFQMKPGLEVYGGFAGTETNRSARNPALHRSILVGHPGAEAVVVSWGQWAPIDQSSVLDGFTITASDSHGILNYQASPTIRNCLIETRNARAPGLAGVGILNNVASAPTISECVLTNNQSGGIANFNGSTPSISNCIFQDNDDSGIVNVAGSSPTISDCVFLNNQAENGAGIFNRDASPIVRSSRFEANVAANEGGAIRTIGGAPVFEQLVLWRNQAGRGGAMAHQGDTLKLVNCTLSENQATGESGGVHLNAGTIHILNSIFWANTAASPAATLESAQVGVTAGTVAISNSCIQGLQAFSGNGNSSADPLFVSAAGGNLRLSPHSPAINAGSNSFVSEGLALDLEGNPRIHGGIVDLGAYETQTMATPVVLTASPQSSTACTAGSASFNVAGAAAGSSYIWQVDTGDGFADVTGGPTYQVATGSNSSVLTVNNAQPGTNYQLRFRITGSGFTSAPVTLQVQSPQVWYVRAAATNGTSNGSSWSNAFTSLQQALESVPDCSEIWVADGLYTATAAEPFRLRSSVAVYGGFSGTETQRQQRNWSVQHSVLTAAPDADMMLNYGSLQAVDPTAILDGVVVSNAAHFYAAIQNFNASPTFRNCTFVGNQLRAVLNHQASPVFENCVFTHNPGGGVQNWKSNVEFRQCSFTGNGIAGANFGAIHNSSATTYLLECIFQDNTAQRGSAVANELNSTCVIERCRFESNSADYNGGAIYSSQSTVSARNSLLFDNRSSGSGGAVSASSSTFEVVHCTIAQNTSALGAAGVDAQSSQSTFRNSIAWGNRVAEPTSLEQAQLREDSGSLSATNSIIEGWAAIPGAGNLAADPIFNHPTTGDFSLMRNSPAIDSAGNSDPLAGQLDYAGEPRLSGNDPDCGALEFQSAPGAAVLFARLPQSQAVCQQNPLRFEIVAAGPSNAPVQWQRFSGSAFTNILSNATYVITAAGPTNALTMAEATPDLDGALFRFLVPTLGYTSPELSVQVSAASVIYVNGSNPIAGDGTSWSNAVKTLPQALALWTPCSEIWVAAGTYRQTNSAGLSLSLSLESPMRIYGGFLGTETSREQRNWTTNITRLVGGDLPLFQNVGSLRTIDRRALLDGLTLSGATDQAIVNTLASPTIRHCTFENNGTAILNSQSSAPLLENCSFNYHSNSFGGAICNLYSSPSLVNCVFSNNVSAGRGAALLAIGGNPNITQSSFYHNRSDGIGGAVCIENGAGFVVSHCAFIGNAAADWGGAISVSMSTGKVSDSLLAQNHSAYRGGALGVMASSLALNHCTMANNDAAWTGGGIQAQGPGLAITNSILWDNQQGNQQQDVEHAQIQLADSPMVHNSIIAGLAALAGNGNQAYNPLFIDAADGDFRLSPFSPGIDAGAALASGTTDLDGSTRLVGAALDCGAYEFQATNANATPFYVLEAPQPTTVCVGDTASFSVTGQVNAFIAYTWQMNSGSGWTIVPLDNGTNFVSATSSSSTLTISNVPSAMSGTQYRFVATGPLLPTPFTGAAVTLTVSVPGVLFVKQNAAGNHTGTDWVNAFTNLNLALQAATPCSEIWVATGTYLPPASGSVALKDGVEIYGGFAGQETNRMSRNWTNNPTVLSGNNSSGYLVNSGLAEPITRAAVLDGFVITGSGMTLGMALHQASPTIRNCHFSGNGWFAASISSDSHPLFDNCAFVSNNFGALDLRDHSSVMLTNCAFSGNTSVGQGGALAIENASATLDRCRFDANAASFGGAIYLGDGGKVVARHCRFSGNLASEQGGALLAEPTALGAWMTNCLFVRGGAFVGGAVASYAPVSLVNCTVAANTAYGRGSGVFVSGASATVRNTILWGNSDTYAAFGNRELAQLEAAGATVSIRNSVLEGLATYSGNFNLPYDPLFVNAPLGDFRIQDYNSPAANAGDNLAIAGITTDLDYNPRLLYVGDTVDIGAYESSTVNATPIYILRQPLPVTVCGGDTASFTVQVAPGTAPSFSWQKKAPGGSFEAVNPGGAYSIATTGSASTLTISNVSTSLDSYEFRIAVLSQSYQGDPALLTVTAPTTTYVKTDAPAGGDGQSWTTAYNSLATALAAANSCRPEIWIAAGTYYATAGTNQLDSFEIPTGIRIYGGFAGTETLLTQRDPESNPVVLSGDIGVAGDPADNSDYVVLFNGSLSPLGPNTLLDGVVVEGARQAGALIFHASPSLRGCVLRLNRGSGLNVTGGGPHVERCSFWSNIGGGGASIVDATNAVFVQCVFSGNAADSAGGGLNLANSTVALTNCLISGNLAPLGAGIRASGGAGSLIHCTVTANAGASATGAGLGSVAGNWTIRNTILWGNRAASQPTEAAQLSFAGGTFSIEHTAIQGLSVFAGNSNQGQYPLFVAPADAANAPTTAGNFNLQPCSPAIDAGNGNLVIGLAEDLNGNARQVNSNVDLGAYEFPTSPAASLTIIAQPADLSFCLSGSNYFEVVASSAPIYQWQMSPTNGQPFVPLTNDALFSGVHAARLNLNSAAPEMDGAQFRVRITTVEGCELVSQTARLATGPGHRYVRADASPGGDGRSWATAYNNLRGAILNPCVSELWVAAGTYNGGSQSFPLRDGMAVYGGFAGFETQRNQRDWKANPTKLTGASFYIVDATVTTQPIGPTARLDGFLFDGVLRALFTSGSSPTIANCVFKNGQRTAVTLQSGAPIFEDCVFENNNVFNSSELWGGAIDAYDTLLTLNRCIFRGNRSAAYGGAIYVNSGSSIAAANCVFSGNRSQFEGGAISTDGPLVLRNCTLSGNRALVLEGAGVRAWAPVEIYNSVLWNNAGQFGITLEAQITADQIAVTHSILQAFDPLVHTWITGDAISSDPLFLQPVDPASAPTSAGDLQAGPLSPAIDAGIDAAKFGVLDLAGRPRISGPAVDIGAYETLQVENIAPRLLTSLAGNLLVIAWPSNLVGARLESNSVNLGATDQWFTVPGSTSSNLISLPIDRSKPNVFFRIIYP